MEENTQITLFNEDGELKKKEDFLNEVSTFYDKASSESNGDPEDDPEYILINSEICPDALQDRFNYLSRTIYINGDINQETLVTCTKWVRYWNVMDEEISIEKRNPIRIVINSNGGELLVSIAISNMLKLSRTPVYTYNICYAYSAAFVIFLGGHKRYCYPNSWFLYHLGSASLSDSAGEIIKFANIYSRQLHQMKKILKDNSYLSLEEIDKFKDGDWYFDAAEAEEKGFAKIIDKLF